MTGSERLRAAFDARIAEGRHALVPYFTGGDGGLESTEQVMEGLVEGGADIIELGVPFSDPTADGTTIQLAAERSLAGGTTVAGLLELVGRFSQKHDTPVVLFGYYNPFFRYGLDKFAQEAAAAGACGVLCVDLPPEEAEPFVTALRANGMALIPLVTPVSGDDRIAAAATLADAFGYYVSATGVTGLSLSGRSSISERVADVRSKLGAHLVVGFGVRTPEDAARMAQGADGVVVGTALVELAHSTPESQRRATVRDYFKGLRAAV
ncbi:MAG: tryptophan synthase alpha chain [Myxococcota bacterium]|jgi:tryptophan synthase alpha chain